MRNRQTILNLCMSADCQEPDIDCPLYLDEKEEVIGCHIDKKCKQGREWKEE